MDNSKGFDAVKKSEKILSTKGEILAYCGISETSFKTYLSLGIPVRVIGGRYTSHKDNLDDFFRNLTCRQDLNDSGQTENSIQGDTVPDAE